MKQKIYELEQLTFQIDKESVFKSLNCSEDSPAYEDFQETYDEIYEEMCSLVEPVGVIGIASMPSSIASANYPVGTPIIYMVTSVGDGLKQHSTKAFQEGDYVKGMLCDAMADDALFSMEDQLMQKLKEICAEHQFGVLARLEAPHHISMEVQKEAWQYLQLENRFGIQISSGYMFDPVKTSCQLLILTEDTSVFQAEHDCRKCPNLNCRLRSIPDTKVIVHREKDVREIFVKEQESLLEALIRENYYVSAVCGGKGRCGKCRIRVLSGETFITEEDKAVFTQEELKAGWRLSCRVYPQEELVIAFDIKDESGFEVLSEFAMPSAGKREDKAIRTGRELEAVSDSLKDKCESDNTAERVQNLSLDTDTIATEYDIAVDIGTTTLVLQLLDHASGKVIHTVSTVNSQRMYGADVISRIQASIDGKKEELQECIRRDLTIGIRKLLQECEWAGQKIHRIVISGNTTMGHLLMGYPCDTLGTYPFTPVNIDFIKGSVAEILGDQTFFADDRETTNLKIAEKICKECDIEVLLLPGISTYVGGDITSGLYACDFADSDEICLLVDLGTNGEMAIGNKEKILVTSTAAGPAFEGGNITWGTGSIPGAICSVELVGEQVQIRTINDQPPLGICGTGVVETTAELVREEIAEDSGMLDEEYFEDGFPLAETLDGQKIMFTQKDIREIQLAKAAVRAGMETLILRYGVSKEAVKKVYIAGGFGYKLNISKAVAIGMIPPEFESKTIAVGNSSLAGAAKYLREQEAEKVLRRLVTVSEEVNLSADKDFNELYMDAMFF